MKPQVCILGLNEITADMVPDFQISERCENAAALFKHLSFTNPEAVILDLGLEDALTVILSLREQFPKIAIVGVTSEENATLVIEALRAGCAQIARRPIDPNDLTIALRRAAGQFNTGTTQGEIIAAFGTRGTGSTTVATYLGIELAAQSQQPTALFDLDLEFGGVARLFDVSPTYTVADLGEVGDADRTILDRASFSPVDNLRVFARPNEIEESHGLHDSVIANILRIARGAYNHIVCDLPPTLNPITGATIERCHKLLLIVQLSVQSVYNATRVVSALESEGFPMDRVEVVVNRYRKGSQHCTPSMVEKQLKLELAGIIPSDFAAVSEASDNGKILAEQHPVRVAIREIALRLLGKEQEEAPRGWLSKLGFNRS